VLETIRTLVSVSDEYIRRAHPEGRAFKISWNQYAKDRFVVLQIRCKSTAYVCQDAAQVAKDAIIYTYGKFSKPNGTITYKIYLAF